MPVLRNKICSAVSRAFTGVAIALATTGAARAETPDNDALLAAAAKNAAKITDANPGPYADDVRRMQDEMDAWVKAHPDGQFKKIIILDTDTFDAQTALGVPPEKAVRSILAKQGHKTPSKAHVEQLAKSLMATGETENGQSVATVKPGAQMDLQNRVCTVIPVLGNTLLTEAGVIPGLDTAAVRLQSNRHEIAHCTNGIHDSSLRAHYAGRMAFIGVRDLMYMDDVMGAMSLEYRSETYSDVKAAGDMVRTGYPLSAVEDMALWRAGWAARDLMHASTPALIDLAREIGKTGLQAFRALPEDAAVTLYETVTERNGFTSGPALQAFYKMQHGWAHEQKSVLDRAVTGDRETMQGLSMLFYTQARKPPPDVSADVQAAHTSRIAAFDPREGMLSRAFGNEGEITPETLLRSYNALQGDLRRSNDNDRDAKAAKMKTIFSIVIKTTDYKAENARRAPKAATP